MVTWQFLVLFLYNSSIQVKHNFTGFHHINPVAADHYISTTYTHKLSHVIHDAMTNFPVNAELQLELQSDMIEGFVQKIRSCRARGLQ